MRKLRERAAQARRRPRRGRRRARRPPRRRARRTAAETVELFWACQWLGAVFVPLSWRSARADLDYCIEDCGATLVATEDDALEALSAGGEHAGALDLEDEALSIMLYTSGTTGRPKGVPRSHRAERAGGLSQVVHHGLEPGDRTLGVMPLYHTMGDHSLIAMSLIGGCYVVQPDWSPEAAPRPDRAGADHVALPRPDALPRPRLRTRASPSATSRRCGASPTRAQPMTSALAETRRRGLRARRSSSTTTARPRSTPSPSTATSARSPGARAARR